MRILFRRLDPGKNFPQALHHVNSRQFRQTVEGVARYDAAVIHRDPHVVDDHVPEMITLFHVCGALIYFDEADRPVGHDDVHTKIALCRDHFERVGLGADYVEQFIR